MPCTKGMTGCHRMCQHRQLVEEYRAARLNDEMTREESTRGWGTELSEYHAILTFRAYLRMMRKLDSRG